MKPKVMDYLPDNRATTEANPAVVKETTIIFENSTEFDLDSNNGQIERTGDGRTDSNTTHVAVIDDHPMSTNTKTGKGDDNDDSNWNNVDIDDNNQNSVEDTDGSKMTCDCTTSGYQDLDRNSVYDPTPPTTDAPWTKVINRKPPPESIKKSTLITPRIAPKERISFNNTSSNEDANDTSNKRDNRKKTTGILTSSRNHTHHTIRKAAFGAGRGGGRGRGRRSRTTPAQQTMRNHNRVQSKHGQKLVWRKRPTTIM